jgi:hypothetical protein
VVGTEHEPEVAPTAKALYLLFKAVNADEHVRHCKALFLVPQVSHVE